MQEDIEKLKQNWNGYHAAPIPHKIINLCRDIVKELPIQPEIFPTCRKTIQMQYELDTKDYLEFEIYENKISVLKVPLRKYDMLIEFDIDICQKSELIHIVNDFVHEARPE